MRMLKKTPTSVTPAFAEFADPFTLSRRSLLRLALAGGAFALAPSALIAAEGEGAPASGGTLTIGADADPIGLDPTTLTAFSSHDFTALIYTGLLRWNARMEIEPDLAVSYEMPDD